MTKPKTFLSNLIIKPIKSFLNKDEQKEEDLEKIAAREQKIFPYDVLVSATNNFSIDHKLGEGGFGPVYKGKLEDGRVVAVKKLSLSSNQGKKEFMNEAKLLARVQHRNVVNLLGYCIHGNDKLLVYEYLHNQSLDKFLFHNKKRGELDWNMRYDVIVGVARGLLYLHEDSHVSIIHRDIKASNILLDEKWTPKIADFGMARLFPEDQTHVNTRVAGTNGYMAPEYVMHGQLSNKADVYSFGVLVLELVSGKKNSTFYMEDAQNLLEWAWMLYKKEKSLELMDAVMVSKAPTDQVDLCIKMGLLCVQAAPKARPTMRRVVVMLSRKSVPEEPTEPGYPGYRYNRRRVRKLPGSTSTAESGESSHRPASTSSMTGSSAESSQNYDSTFNASSSSTSTTTRPHQLSHGRHGNDPASHASSSSSTPTNTRPHQHSHGRHGNGPASHASSSSSTPTNTRPHQLSHGRHGNGRASHALIIRSPNSQQKRSTSTPTITSPTTDHSAGKRPATN